MGMTWKERTGWITDGADADVSDIPSGDLAAISERIAAACGIR